MSIHPTAIVDPQAEIDGRAEIGPYCVIGPDVIVGPGTRLVSHVVLENHVELGANNVVFPFAVLGGAPQDLKFKGEPSWLRIGDGNQIRESVTMSIGTAHGHMETRIGNGGLFMAYAHVAHDCLLGDQVIMANGVSLAGHVTLGDRVIMGGMAGVHQFTRVGRAAFVGGGAMVARDVPPYCVAQGDRARLVNINVIGVKRAGWSKERIRLVRQAFKRLFFGEVARLTALSEVEAELGPRDPAIAEICQFVRESKRGVALPRRPRVSSEDDDLDE